MPSSDAFALRRSGLNNFLFAAVGDEHFGLNGKLVELAKKHRRIALLREYCAAGRVSARGVIN